LRNKTKGRQKSLPFVFYINYLFFQVGNSVFGSFDEQTCAAGVLTGGAGMREEDENIEHG